MSDMAVLRVKNRDFQRATAEWLHRAKQGNTVVIISSGGPSLTLTAGRPQQAAATDWEGHFTWLERQPLIDVNPVDELRRTDKR